jgi:hypothetical protein
MSLEDLFQKKLCICGHSKDEHAGNCYALDFNGTIYSACSCPQFKAKSLIFKIENEYEVLNNIKRAIPKPATKPIQPRPFIVFGKNSK